MSGLPVMPKVLSPVERDVLRGIAVGVPVPPGPENCAAVERLLQFGMVLLEMGEPCASDAGLRELGLIE